MKVKKRKISNVSVVLDLEEFCQQEWEMSVRDVVEMAVNDDMGIMKKLKTYRYGMRKWDELCETGEEDTQQIYEEYCVPADYMLADAVVEIINYIFYLGKIK